MKFVRCKKNGVTIKRQRTTYYSSNLGKVFTIPFGFKGCHHYFKVMKVEEDDGGWKIRVFHLGVG